MIGLSYTEVRKGKEDPFSLRPHPQNMSTALTADEFIQNQDLDSKDNEGKSNVYKAPKISATLMDEDKKERKNKRLDEANKRKLMKSMVLREIEEDVYDLPTEIRKNNFIDPYEQEQEKKIIDYEEDNFTRLPVTKKDKKKLSERTRKMEGRVDDFEEIDKLRDLIRDEYMDKEVREQENQEKMKKTMNAHAQSGKRKFEAKRGKPKFGGKSDDHGERPKKKVKFGK